MQKLRDRFENSMKLVAHLYKDISLRDEFRMVSIATKSFMVEYSKTLEQQKISQDIVWFEILVLEFQPNNNSKNNKYTSPYETEFILVMHWVPTTIKLYNYVSVTVDK